MKKKTNLMFLFLGVLMIGILVYQQRSFIKNTFYSLLNVHKTQEIESAPEKDILNTNHQEYLDTMKDSSLGTGQHEYSTIQKIYERDKDISAQEPMLFEGNFTTANQGITIQILKYFSSKDIATIADGASSVTLMNTEGDTFMERTSDNYELYDIEPDNPFIVRYVIAIPEEVFDTDLHVCTLTTVDAFFPMDEDKVQLRVLTDIPQK